MIWCDGFRVKYASMYACVCVCVRVRSQPSINAIVFAVVVSFSSLFSPMHSYADCFFTFFPFFISCSGDGSSSNSNNGGQDPWFVPIYMNCRLLMLLHILSLFSSFLFIFPPSFLFRFIKERNFATVTVVRTVFFLLFLYSASFLIFVPPCVNDPLLCCFWSSDIDEELLFYRDWRRSRLTLYYYLICRAHNLMSKKSRMSSEDGQSEIR